MGKIYTRFQTKKAQNPYPMGRTYLYGFYKGVPPPRPLGLFYIVRLHSADSTLAGYTEYFFLPSFKRD